MATQKPGRTTAIIAYLTLIGTLIAISINGDEKHDFARFHTRQAFGLHLIFLGMAFFLSYWFNLYAWVGLYIFYFVCWIYGFIGAVGYKRNSVPVLGPYFQKWFTFIP